MILRCFSCGCEFEDSQPTTMFCPLPKCQDERVRYKKLQNIEYQRTNPVRHGRRHRTIILCEHCKKEFLGRRNQLFCRKTPDCVAASEVYYRRASRPNAKVSQGPHYERKECSLWGRREGCGHWITIRPGDDPRFQRFCPRCREWAASVDMETAPIWDRFHRRAAG